MELKVDLIRDKEEFKNIKTEWDNLLNKSNNPNIFLTWEWLYEWYDNLVTKEKLYIITVRNNKDLLGIAPFINTLKPILNIKIIKFLGSSFVYSDYLDLIIRDGFEDIVVKEIFSFLLSHFNDWDIINLTDMNLESINKKFIVNESTSNNLHIKINQGTKCPYILLPSRFEDFFQSLGHDTRYKIKKSSKKLMSMHNIKMITVEDKELLEQALIMMFETNSKRWLMEDSQGSFFTKKLKDFNSAISKRFLENGWLRFDYIQLENKMISYCYNFKFKNKIYGYSTSYLIDDKFNKYSPGKILQIKCIESAIKENATEYDMLRGISKYKYNLTKSERQLINIFIFRKKFKSKIYFLLMNIFNFSLRISRKIIPKKIRKKIGEKYLRR